MTKRDRTQDEDFKSRDLKRNRTGWKAQLKDARRAKNRRKSAEGAIRKEWK